MNAKTTEGTEAHGTIKRRLASRRFRTWRMYELAIDPAYAKSIRDSRSPEDSDACTMCGDYCALKIVKQNFDFAR